MARAGIPAGAPTAGAAPRLHPAVVLYVVAALATLGLAAVMSATTMAINDINTDIWQHLAALGALMSDPAGPANPFVASEESSRHFHPLWVGLAWIGRALGLSPWDVLGLASALSMGVLAAGILTFARAYFASPWAPLALLAAMMAGWAIQPHHTGFHSFHTLLYGAAYPATFLIGCSLLLWGLAIRSLGRAWIAALLLPLTAIMVATHQLGAAIGLIGAGSFILLWPEGRPRARLRAALAIVAGVGLSMLWPYHSPLALVLSPGNSSWEGGPNFYNPAYVALFTLPVAFGVLGLRDERGRAVLAAIAVFGCAYLVGLTGAQVAGRFLMPIVLCLHIGVAAVLLRLFAHPRVTALPSPVRVVALGLSCAVWLGASLSAYPARDGLFRGQTSAPYAAALALTADIPDHEEVAAFDLTAWPVVGTGQRVHSVPWPEPGIADLAARQAATERLFDPALTAETRAAEAETLGIRTLIADRRIAPPEVLSALATQALHIAEEGTLIRFDLAE